MVPSGRLLSSRIRLVGSLTAGIWARSIALGIIITATRLVVGLYSVLGGGVCSGVAGGCVVVGVGGGGGRLVLRAGQVSARHQPTDGRPSGAVPRRPGPLRAPSSHPHSPGVATRGARQVRAPVSGPRPLPAAGVT